MTCAQVTIWEVDLEHPEVQLELKVPQSTCCSVTNFWQVPVLALNAHVVEVVEQGLMPPTVLPQEALLIMQSVFEHWPPSNTAHSLSVSKVAFDAERPVVPAPLPSVTRTRTNPKRTPNREMVRSMRNSLVSSWERNPGRSRCD